MKTIFSLIVSTLIAHCAYSQTLLDTISIAAGKRNITNLSGKLNDSVSFHMIINKVKSNQEFESVMHFVGKVKNAKVFDPIITDSKPTFLTFLKNGSVVTFLRKKKTKGYEVIDFDYSTKQIRKKSLNISHGALFDFEDILFIGLEPVSEIVGNIVRIKASDDAQIISVNLKDNQVLKRVFKQMNKSKRNIKNIIEAINDKAFISNGPILPTKAYYHNDRLIFVVDDNKTSTTSVFPIAQNGLVKAKEFFVLNKKKSKRQNSFLKGNLLFIFSMLKNISELNIYNIKTDKKIKKIVYNSKTLGHHQKIVSAGKDVTKTVKYKRFYRGFFTSGGIETGSYQPGLYVAVNPTENNDYLVRIGHVNKTVYYPINTFWGNFNAFQLNHHTTTTAKNLGIGAGVASGIAVGVFAIVSNELAKEKNKGNYLEFSLDKNMELIKEPQQPLYKYFDIEKYEEFLKNKEYKLKKHFVIDMKDKVRFINFDSKAKTYFIYEMEPLDSSTKEEL